MELTDAALLEQLAGRSTLVKLLDALRPMDRVDPMSVPPLGPLAQALRETGHGIVEWLDAIAAAPRGAPDLLLGERLQRDLATAAARCLRGVEYAYSLSHPDSRDWVAAALARPETAVAPTLEDTFAAVERIGALLAGGLPAEAVTENDATQAVPTGDVLREALRQCATVCAAAADGADLDAWSAKLGEEFAARLALGIRGALDSAPNQQPLTPEQVLTATLGELLGTQRGHFAEDLLTRALRHFVGRGEDRLARRYDLALDVQIGLHELQSLFPLRPDTPLADLQERLALVAARCLLGIDAAGDWILAAIEADKARQQRESAGSTDQAAGSTGPADEEDETPEEIHRINESIAEALQPIVDEEYRQRIAAANAEPLLSEIAEAVRSVRQASALAGHRAKAAAEKIAHAALSDVAAARDAAKDELSAAAAQHRQVLTEDARTVLVGTLGEGVAQLQELRETIQQAIEAQAKRQTELADRAIAQLDAAIAVLDRRVRVPGRLTEQLLHAIGDLRAGGPVCTWHVEAALAAVGRCVGLDPGEVALARGTEPAGCAGDG